MHVYETIRECAVLLDSGIVASLRPLLIGSDQFNALGALDGAPDLRMNEIASMVLLDDSTTTRIVDGLEARGLVARRADPRDRRARRVSITEEGRHLLMEARERCEETVAGRLAPLGARRVATLERALEELRSVLLTEGDDV